MDQFIDSEPVDFDQFLTENQDQGGYLDKSIEGTQFLLDAANLPVILAPTELPGQPIESVDGEIYFGLSAGLVKRFAENLRTNSFDVLAPHFDIEQMNRAHLYPATWRADDLNYLRKYYGRLVGFFDRAATANAAVLLTTG